jgi:hypothetical protein
MVQDLVYTKTVDVTLVNKILAHCPHYDSIVNYEFEYGDNFSSKLIDWYRELIFAVNCNDEKQLKVVEALDNGLYLYVKDNQYKREFRKQLKPEDINLESKKLIKDLIKKIIVFTSKYEQRRLMEFTSSIWI